MKSKRVRVEKSPFSSEKMVGEMGMIPIPKPETIIKWTKDPDEYWKDAIRHLLSTTTKIQKDNPFIHLVERVPVSIAIPIGPDDVYEFAGIVIGQEDLAILHGREFKKVSGDADDYEAPIWKPECDIVFRNITHKRFLFHFMVGAIPAQENTSKPIIVSSVEMTQKDNTTFCIFDQKSNDELSKWIGAAITTRITYACAASLGMIGLMDFDKYREEFYETRNPIPGQRIRKVETKTYTCAICGAIVDVGDTGEAYTMETIEEARQRYGDKDLEEDDCFIACPDCVEKHNLT